MGELSNRLIAGTTKFVVTPFYIDDDLRAEIVLGEHAKRWSDIRPMLEREGLPKAMRSIAGLYYLPALLQFFEKREGISAGYHYSEDGPENFGP
jgi:hypothetical protein